MYMLTGSAFINGDDILLFIRRKSQKESYWHHRFPPFLKSCASDSARPRQQAIL